MAGWSKNIWIYLKYILLVKTGLIEDIPPPSPFHSLIINVLEGILFSTGLVLTTFLIANFKLALFYKNMLKNILENRKLKKDTFIEMYSEVKPRLKSVCDLNEKIFKLEDEKDKKRESFLCNEYGERDVEDGNYMKDLYLKLKTILEKQNKNSLGRYVEFTEENPTGVLYPADELNCNVIKRNTSSKNSLTSDFKSIEEDDKEVLIWLFKKKMEFERSFPELFERAEKEMFNLNNKISPGLSEFYKMCSQNIQNESLDGIYSNDFTSLIKFHQIENHSSKLNYSNCSAIKNSSRGIARHVFNKTKYKPIPKHSKTINKTKRLTGFSNSTSTPSFKSKNRISDNKSISRSNIFQESKEYLMSKEKTEDIQEVGIKIETSSNSLYMECISTSSLDNNNNILSLNDAMVNEMIGPLNIPHQIHQFKEVKSLQKNDQFATRETVAEVERDICIRKDISSCGTGSHYNNINNKTLSVPFERSLTHDYQSLEHYPTERTQKVELECLYFMDENRHKKCYNPPISFNKSKDVVANNFESQCFLERNYGDQYYKKKSAHGLILRKEYFPRSNENNDFAYWIEFEPTVSQDNNNIYVNEGISYIPAKTNDKEPNRSLSDSSLTDGERNSHSKLKPLGKNVREIKSSGNIEREIGLKKEKKKSETKSRIPVRIKSKKEVASSGSSDKKEVTIGSNKTPSIGSLNEKDITFKNVKKRNNSRRNKKTLSLLLEEEDDKASLDLRFTPLEENTGGEDKLIKGKLFKLLPERGRRHGRFPLHSYQRDPNLYTIMEEDETEEIEK